MYPLASGAVSLAFVGAVFTSIAARNARTLEGKFGALRRLVVIDALALALLVAEAVMGARAVPRAAGTVDAQALPALWAEQRDLARDQFLLVGAIAFVLLTAVPVVLHVLRELQGFVLAQRLDLAARDQAMQHQEPMLRA